MLARPDSPVTQSPTATAGSTASAVPGSQSGSFTSAELECFNKWRYYAWGQGFFTGGLIFVATFGGLRWAALRRRHKAQALTASSSSTSSSAMSTKSKSASHWHALDRPSLAQQPKQFMEARSMVPKKGSSFRKKQKGWMEPDPNMPSVPPPPSLFAKEQGHNNHTNNTIHARPNFKNNHNKLEADDDLMWNLQFMCCGLVSVVLGQFVAWLNSDRTALYRNLAQVPLQPGTSYYCHALCPALLQQVERIKATGRISARGIDYGDGSDGEGGSSQHEATTFESSNGSGENNGDKTISNEPDVLFDARSLWEDPVLEELESLVQMVHNCQQRMSYEQELRRRVQRQRGNGSDADLRDNDVVDIPPPGVPVDYVHVVSSS